MTPDPHNQVFQLAARFITLTNRSVFLTGKAGTGKTTFLKYIRSTAKQHAVLAPTGVAAINAGGTTIHSFFQLPFGPFLPQSAKGFSAINDDVIGKHSLLERLRFNKEKQQLIKSLELLIIDEISMVRSDVLDAIDTILRYFRNKESQPFGGVQMLFIGDMYQLPPVMPDDQWKILREHYDSPYFFDSQVIKKHPPVYIELDKIYRQNEQAFIDVLNEVRNNKLSTQGLQLLHSRYLPAFSPGADENYITLTTHNIKADAINESHLAILPDAVHEFDAIIEGEFSERNYPADAVLQLKEGAQVMFIKNDIERPRRFFNGKIGIVESFTDDGILIRCKDNDELIKLEKEIWNNVQYSLNRKELRVEEKVLGSFRQYPLRLAWAITIHKSQGLTFEKAIIDAGASFAPGQVYVALSRCTSLQGMVLHSQLRGSSVFTDQRINQFIQTQRVGQNLQAELKQAERAWQQSILMDMFDQDELLIHARLLTAFIKKNTDAFNKEALSWVQENETFCDTLKETGKKFQNHLLYLIDSSIEMPEENEPLQQRLKQAANWFLKQFISLVDSIKAQPAVTDSRQLSKEFEALLSKLITDSIAGKQMMESCLQGFNAIAVQIARSKIQIANVVGLAYAGTARQKVPVDSEHPELLRQLRQLRNEICDTKNLPVYLVAGTTTLNELVEFLPQSTDELSYISGFGKAKIESYGEAFVALIKAYCEKHGLSGNIQEKITSKPKRQRKASLEEPKEKIPKVNTRQLSYDMYQQGKTVSEIAFERTLTKSTIEGHLVEFILDGKLPLQALVSDEQFATISRSIKGSNGSIGAVRVQLENAVSYTQVRLVKSWLELNGS